jgi:hypothetical protein
MELSLRGFGMGDTAVSPSGVAYNDTGAGLTPDNFTASCCNGPGGGFGSTWLGAVFGIGSSDCSTFYAANTGVVGATVLGNPNPCPNNSAVQATQAAGQAAINAAGAVGSATGALLGTAAQAAGQGLGSGLQGAGSMAIPLLLIAGLVLYVVLEFK